MSVMEMTSVTCCFTHMTDMILKARECGHMKARGDRSRSCTSEVILPDSVSFPSHKAEIKQNPSTLQVFTFLFFFFFFNVFLQEIQIQVCYGSIILIGLCGFPTVFFFFFLSCSILKRLESFKWTLSQFACIPKIQHCSLY